MAIDAAVARWLEAVVARWPWPSGSNELCLKCYLNTGPREAADGLDGPSARERGAPPGAAVGRAVDGARGGPRGREGPRGLGVRAAALAALAHHAHRRGFDRFSGVIYSRADGHADTQTHSRPDDRDSVCDADDERADDLRAERRSEWRSDRRPFSRSDGLAVQLAQRRADAAAVPTRQI